MNMKTKTPAIFIGILFLTGCQNLKEVGNHPKLAY